LQVFDDLCGDDVGILRLAVSPRLSSLSQKMSVDQSELNENAKTRIATSPKAEFRNPFVFSGTRNTYTALAIKLALAVKRLPFASSLAQSPPQRPKPHCSANATSVGVKLKHALYIKNRNASR
jgi:hypothetical protein